MKPLFIILAMSKTGAVAFIILLLIVAAIIGYITAWYYAKWIYTPIIKKLEAEKTELNKQVAGLKEEVSKLSGKIEKLNEKISKLEDELEEMGKAIKHLKKKGKV